MENENLWKSVEFDYLCSLHLKLSDYYVLEDEENKCLAFANTGYTYTDDDHDGLCLQYFAAYPNRKEDEYKYIGETFINFLCKLAKKEMLDNICIPKALKDAVPFYTKCGFEPYTDPFGKNHIILKGENMEKLIAQNEEHTGSKIDYIF